MEHEPISGVKNRLGGLRQLPRATQATATMHHCNRTDAEVDPHVPDRLAVPDPETPKTT